MRQEVALHNPEAPRQQHDCEWQFLRLLCAGNLPETLRTELCANTLAAAFTEVLNRVAFEEICRVTTRAAHGSAKALREHLRSRLTARGFPDVDFDDLLDGAELETGDVVARIRSARHRLMS
jgi:hypothetical protein